MDRAYKEAVEEEILKRLTEGESLSSICRSENMPAWSTIHSWMEDDDNLRGQIMRAREAGYHFRAEKAIQEAKSASDAGLGRLAFDAERWYLGKLSNAFSDKVKHVGGDADDAPIRMEHASKIDMSKLNDEQLRVLASIRIPTE